MFTKTMIVSAGLLLAIPAAPAFADDSNDGVETKGTCSAGAFWELKSEEHDGGVEVKFEVTSGGAGQAWSYSLSGPSGVLRAGTRTADSDGEFTVKMLTDGTASDPFTATATSDGQVCDSTVGVLADDSDVDGDDDAADDESGDDQSGDDDAYEGSCSAGSTLDMTVVTAGKSRIAKLSLKGTRAGQKWRYSIHRGKKAVDRGVARTKGKNARLKVTKKTRGKGALSASAVRVGGTEDCSVDDDVSNDEQNEDQNDD